MMPVLVGPTHPVLPPPLLAERTARPRAAGRIRSGLMVLADAARQVPGVAALYEEGLAAGTAFGDLVERLRAACPQIEHPLVPQSTPYFVVRPTDFANPELAYQILDAHGEDRGDGVRRLYRFPAVFDTDAWQLIMPHELVCWEGGERRYWSVYASDGATRNCVMRKPDGSGAPAVRGLAGPQLTPRPDTAGACVPEACPQYQAAQCRLHGRFIFHIPGVKSMGGIELHVNSFAAVEKAVRLFEAVAGVRGGRISGFLDDHHTPFYMTKVLRPVRYLDERGKLVKDTCWSLELEAPVDVADLLRLRHDDQGAEVRAERAAHLLEAPRLPTLPRGGFRAPAAMPLARPLQAGPIIPEITDLLLQLNVNPVRFQLYADARYGAGWKLNTHGRGRVLDEIAQYRANPEALRRAIADI